MEVWKDIKGYEGMYQISSLGRVKSLKRKGVLIDKIIKNCIDNHGYSKVNLSKNCRCKNFMIHKLVAIAFLNHEPCGHKIVVDHKNNIKTDNRLSNLQLTTARHNNSKDKPKGSSRYTGVCKYKNHKKWVARIKIDKKTVNLGCFDCEKDASEAYQEAVRHINNGDTHLIEVKTASFSSKYKGVSWDSKKCKWISQVRIDGKQRYIGTFNCEIEAAKACKEALKTL